MNQPPQLSCCRLPAFNSAKWNVVFDIFHAAPPCLLQQFWREHPESDFRPARVYTGWTDKSLFVLAELDDDDIFNPTTELNVHSYLHGDVFEMFLRPLTQTAYYELHVTPQNQKFQMRIPSAQEFTMLQGREIPLDWMISHRVIESHVQVCSGMAQWRVLAEVPFDLVVEGLAPQVGSQWLFSFSRYDYSQSKSDPILSSTSRHTVPLSFHRQEEWGMLTFV